MLLRPINGIRRKELVKIGLALHHKATEDKLKGFKQIITDLAYCNEFIWFCLPITQKWDGGNGEIFVSKLEELVTGKNAVERYMFLPADSLDERGIVIRYRDPSIPLVTARVKFEEGSLKDCAAKCRQAVECITGSLWSKMAPHVNGGISVNFLRNDK